MARTWYEIHDGVAPWSQEEAWSYTVTNSFTVANESNSGSTYFYESTKGNSLAASLSATYQQTFKMVAGTSTWGGVAYTQSGLDISAYLSRSSRFERGATTTATITTYATGINGFTNQLVSTSATTDGRTLRWSTHQTLQEHLLTTSYTSTYSGSGTAIMGTSPVTTGYSLGTYSSGYYDTTEVNSDSSIVTVSTAITQSTNTATSSAASDTVSFVSTTTDLSPFTSHGITYLTRVGQAWVAMTTSYIPAYQYLVPVISADTHEYLKLQTTTGSSGVSQLSDLLGGSFTMTTLSATPYTLMVDGAGVGAGVSNTPTRTISSLKLTTASATITVSAATAASITNQSFDGWVGGTATSSQIRVGATTSTQTIIAYATATTSRTVTADRSLTAYQAFTMVSSIPETITGINAGGGSVEYGIQRTYAYAQWFTYESWEGAIGRSITRYQSPATPFAHEANGQMTAERVERAGGLQAPTAMGSTGAQAHSLTAASSFYIGAGNIGLASPYGILTPFLTYGGSAQTSNSSYSVSFGPTDCSVTAVRTESTGTGTGTSGTTTTFTAAINTAGGGEVFQQAYPVAAISDVQVAGGAHARTGGEQHIVISGFGRRYTLGDGVGTTSYKEVGAASLATAALGASIIAAESFRAGVPSPALNAGLPAVHTFAFSAT